MSSLQQSGKWHGTHFYKVVINIKIHFQSWAAKGLQMIFKGFFASQNPHEEHLAAFGCPGFIVEFNTYNIIKMSPMSLTPLL